jgi:TolB protein
MNQKRVGALLFLVSCFMLLRAAPARSGRPNSAPTIGLFENNADVGTVLHPGSVNYNSSKGIYTISGSGNNMWFSNDDFQLLWKKVSGDVTLTADISFVGTGGNPHRKAVLMIRQSLAPDSVYADIARHGVGLTSLQFREAKGATTHEVQANITAPKRLRIEKRGDYFYMFLGEGKQRRLAAGSPRIHLTAPFYVGLGVCSHDKDRIETAKFSKVDLETAPAVASQHMMLYSTLETVAIESGDRREVYTAPGRFEAPNWTHDGKFLIFNRDGHIEKIPVAGGQPETLSTGFATRCNNDHGISPDGTTLAISDNSQDAHQSIIYVLPLAGGTPRAVTNNPSPSYFHGWSPGGKTIAFCGERNHEFDVYTIPATGGKEVQLTKSEGHNDGPEYSPDGKYIYFNSDRTGREQIWRMHPDGAAQEHVISDDTNDWFPHISPDGRLMVFLSYASGVTGHPADKDVMLRIMSMADMKIKPLARLFGGQGTINVDSWSPDSQHVAFVSYHLVPQ